MLADYDAAGVAAVLGLAATHVPDPSSSSGFREDGLQLLGQERRRSPTVAHRAGAPAPTPIAIEQAVARGLPRQVLRHLAERIAGGEAAKVAALEWSVVPKTTLDRRSLSLSPAESERTERVARLFVHAWRALGSEHEARAFMLAPHPELDGRNPVEAARTDLATRRVERLLNVLEYGLAI